MNSKIAVLASSLVALMEMDLSFVRMGSSSEAMVSVVEL